MVSFIIGEDELFVIVPFSGRDKYFIYKLLDSGYPEPLMTYCSIGIVTFELINSSTLTFSQ